MILEKQPVSIRKSRQDDIHTGQVSKVGLQSGPAPCIVISSHKDP